LPSNFKPAYDAIVIGSGPNGLSAAVTIARAKKSVLLLEASDQLGGGTRSAQLTFPGFLHDVCSAVHPMAAASPFFRSLPLREHGLEWIHPPIPLAHPLDDGDAALLYASLDQTKNSLGSDARAYQTLVGTLASNWSKLESSLLASPLAIPNHPFLMFRFGLHALQPATRLAKSYFQTEKARALFAGLAAHSLLPLETWGSSAIALVLAAQAHLAGWPIAKGGSQKIADGLASYLRSLGGEIATNTRVVSTKDLPPARVILCDLSPRGLLRIAGENLPQHYVRALENYQYGAAAFKIDWALRAPIPWKNSECAKAGTIHLGGTLGEIAASERALCTTHLHPQPYVLLSQPTLFDPTRTPDLQTLWLALKRQSPDGGAIEPGAPRAVSEGGSWVSPSSLTTHHAPLTTNPQIAWAYCHVPANNLADMTSAIESQIERFAPGFKNIILARSTKSPLQLESDNANLVGGNITGGANTLRQLFFRPTRLAYNTPLKHLFLCSASTPPGGGVHGMCGYHAALRALSVLK
jgi:phytoene dehydrogenase-like protein